MPYLVSCLSALRQPDLGLMAEILIISDGSPDAGYVSSFLEGSFSLPVQIRHVARMDNRGFAATCNEGARLARSRYLLFLNADTLPVVGWLKALVDFAERNPKAGVLGAKLLFPFDQRIQHCGGMFNDSSDPIHLYYGQPASLRFVHNNRRLQWVTGACQLLRREDFFAVGGLDESYGLCAEDVDLCLKIRYRLRKEAWVVGSSTLYHYESVTGKERPGYIQAIQMLKRRWGLRLQPDEAALFKQDGMALEFVRLVDCIRSPRALDFALDLAARLGLRSAEDQDAYAKSHTAEQLVAALPSLFRGEPLPVPVLQTSPQPAAVQPPQNSEPSTAELFTMLASSGLAKRSENRARLLLSDRLADSSFFLMLYNVASVLQSRAQKRRARQFWSLLTETMLNVPSDLKGKAHFKLALLAHTRDERLKHLRACVTCMPNHHAARAALERLSGRPDRSLARSRAKAHKRATPRTPEGLIPARRSVR
jgi:GT2 family glycosyltransferase